MKKLVLLFIVFFVCFNFVNADTFYGQFRLVEEINNYRDDMLKIETYKLYNTYEKEYLDMGYMIENDKYLIDENDSKVEYVNVLENDVGDEYITVKVDNNKTIYINFSELDPKMKIYELELFYKGSKNYYEFYELPNDDLKKIRDGDLNTYLDCSILDNFKLNLFDAYVLSDIKMILHTNSNEDYIFKLSVPHISPTITLHKNKNNHFIDLENNKDLEKDVSYEYKDYKKLFRHYKEEIIPLNNYVEYGNNLLLDDYIEVNKFFVRDKLVLKDNIIIDNNQKIEDFIEFSSGETNINCNINYTLNGIYNCEFVLNDISVEKEVIVILSNEYEVVDVANEEIIDNENEKTVLVDSKEYTLMEDNNIKSEIKSINDVKKVKLIKNKIEKKYLLKKEKIINLIKYIIIFNLILIEILLFIKKKKK